jgi:hypothetical protein
MTYYRRTYYPQDGLADDPDRIWEEFQRIRAALMGIDQNNVLADGVDRATLTLPSDTEHEGCSDTYDSGNSFARDATAGSVTLTLVADAGIWYMDTATSVTVEARSESVWIVGSSAEWAWTPPGTGGHVAVETRIVSSRGGSSRSISTGVLVDAANKAAASGLTASFLVPAGKCVFTTTYRARWSGAAVADVVYKDRDMFAVGFYQAGT